jgi:hypothetical protein
MVAADRTASGPPRRRLIRFASPSIIAMSPFYHEAVPEGNCRATGIGIAPMVAGIAAGRA